MKQITQPKRPTTEPCHHCKGRGVKLTYTQESPRKPVEINCPHCDDQGRIPTIISAASQS